MATAPDRRPELPPFTPLNAVLRAPTPQKPGPTTPAPTPQAPEDDRRTNRMRTRRAETRTDREHRLELDARRRAQKRQDKADRKAQRRADRAAARDERRTLRADRQLTHAERNARLKNLGTAAARRIMVIGPITAPMAVAWSSQTSYAMTAFGWWLPFALGFAAAWELSTTFTGWMYHQARRAGDRGTEYRILTWVFAMGAAAMNYAHHAGPHGQPTQAAIAFSAMSITGMVLWESYARLVHRQYLRAKGLLPAARPRLGAARWVRYPVHSWTAWSASIHDARLDTLDKAWTAAAQLLADRRAAKQGRAVHCLVVPRVSMADHGPASVPMLRAVSRRLDLPVSSQPMGSRLALPKAETETAKTKVRETETQVSKQSPETTQPAQVESCETKPRETTRRETGTRPARSRKTKTRPVSAIGDPETETRRLLDLMRSRGGAMKVSLDDAMTETGRPKSTAAKRLAAARDRYLAETA